MPFELLWVVVIFGVNFAVWGSIGMLRYGEGVLRRLRSSIGSGREGGLTPGGDPSAIAGAGKPVTVHNVAVLIPAYNEEAVLARSLEALAKLMPRSNIYVVSDASTDRTVAIAREHDVSVFATTGKAGKAGALEQGFREFRLIERYDAVLLLDADTQLDPEYFTQALPLFDDPDVVAVAGCAHTEWNPPGVGLLGKMLISHRGRTYAIMQHLIKIGQTWRRTNALYIIPGFASMYRTWVLPYLDINPPGLVIEDFNMTFEVYRRRLGRVAFTLRAQAVTQDPASFGDYVRQTKRWALGFWQAVRRYRPSAGLFPVMLLLLVTELVIASALIVLLPVLIAFSVLPTLMPGLLDLQPFQLVHTRVDLGLVLIAVLVPDLVLTIAVAILERRPRYLLFAPIFLPLRIVDAAIALYTLPLAWVERSTGSWISPQRRRAVTTTSVQLLPEDVPAKVPAYAASVGSSALSTALQIDISKLEHSPRWTYTAGAGADPLHNRQSSGDIVRIVARVPVQRSIPQRPAALAPPDHSVVVPATLPASFTDRASVGITRAGSPRGVVSGRVAAHIVHQMREETRVAEAGPGMTIVMGEAVLNVVSVAARQVAGVRCAQAAVSRLTAKGYGGGGASDGMDHSIGMTTEIQLALCIQYGFAIQAVTRWVRSAVITALRDLLEVRATSVNIVVRNVSSDTDDRPHDHAL